MARLAQILVLVALTVAGATSAGGSAAPCGRSTTSPVVYKHVVWIWMENHAYTSIIGSSSAPYINSLAAECGLATNYSAIAHPSLPNYIAATSGSTEGIIDDSPPSSHPLSVASLYSQVRELGGTWRDYEESAPSHCPRASGGLYAVKHDPAPYYTPMSSECANWDVPMGTARSGHFLTDLKRGALPTFAFITPNLCDDMHGATGCPTSLILTGDNWLKSWAPRIFAGPNYKAGNTVLVITFDEGDSTSNRVATIIASPSTPPGTESSTAFNHYSLLKTTEQLLGISSYLAHAGDSSTTSMRSAFHL